MQPSNVERPSRRTRCMLRITLKFHAVYDSEWRGVTFSPSLFDCQGGGELRNDG